MHRKLLWTPKCKWGSFISMSNITSHRHSPSLKQKKKASWKLSKSSFSCCFFRLAHDEKKRASHNNKPISPLASALLRTFAPKSFPFSPESTQAKENVKTTSTHFSKAFLNEKFSLRPLSEKLKRILNESLADGVVEWRMKRMLFIHPYLSNNNTYGLLSEAPFSSSRWDFPTFITKQKLFLVSFIFHFISPHSFPITHLKGHLKGD